MSKSDKRDFIAAEKEALQAFLDQEVKQADGKPLSLSSAQLGNLSAKLADLRPDSYVRSVATLSAYLHRLLKPKRTPTSNGDICEMVSESLGSGVKKIAKKVRSILRVACRQTKADKREIKSLKGKVKNLEAENKNLQVMLKRLQKLETAVIEFKQAENSEGLSGLVKRIKKIETAVESAGKEVL